MGLLSGDSKEMGILLLIIMGVLLGLFALGILAEVFLRKSAKRPCKPVSRKFIVTTSAQSKVELQSTVRKNDGDW